MMTPLAYSQALPPNYDMLQQKKADILSLTQRHGAYNIRIFGSVARGQAREDSDIDFLVTVSPRHSPWFPTGLILDLEQLLAYKIDVVTEQALHWYIRDQILKEAIPL